MEDQKKEEEQEINPEEENCTEFKHPLQNTWTLWYFESDRSKTWGENQREIFSFDTIEDFWRINDSQMGTILVDEHFLESKDGHYFFQDFLNCSTRSHLYNNIKRPSELRHGCDYSLFKKGVRPMWEDAANKEGGRWLISLEKKQRNSDLDKYWLEIILCMIGEAFDAHSDEVCGSVVNIRHKGDKIGLWTANGQQAHSVMEIGRKIKEQLKIPKSVTLGYQIHKDSAQKSSSITRNSYEV